jgi:apolipoprotein D and lipocalin family protein
MQRILNVVFVLVSGLVAGCASVPKGVTVVSDLDPTKYLGKWYEIARLDHRFERGLTNVTAEYSLREDGGLNVVNRGFDPAKKTWRQAEGRAYLADKPNVGRLKVSFFRPIYAAYNIIELDREQYSYAMVCGYSTSYLWILSRSPDLDPAIRDKLLAKARDWGFDTSALIFVSQEVR